MALHFERSKFRHPAPEDFFRAVNEAAGRDLTWFFDQVYRSSNEFDYGVADLQSRPSAARGLVEQGGQLRFSRGDDGSGDTGAQAAFDTTVVVRRHGEAVFPVDVEVRFEDGSRVRERWNGRDRWKTFTFTRPARGASAVVDPDRVLLLDVDTTNNSRALSPAAGRAATKWAAKWIVWLQDVLATYAFFV